MKIHYLILFIFFTFLPVKSQTALPAFFSDNMVLQQKENISIWGKDTPETQLKITTSWGESAEITADENGVWKTKIKTNKGSFTSETIKIIGTTNVILKNVLIGEVWFCSGQSNMEMPLNGFRKSKVKNSDVFLEKSKNKHIRLFSTPRKASVLPVDNINSKWVVSDLSAAKKFSAVGYMFGVKLHENLKVPIGIIEASWGGTRIESWTPKETLQKYKKMKFYDKVPTEEKKRAKPSFLYNGMIYPFQDFTIKGFLWYQGETNRGNPKPYKNYMIDMVAAWRTQWNSNELPFYFVQIAPFNYPKANKGIGLNPNLIREQQVKASKEIKNTGIVITTDVGDCNDIHPSKKETIADRLLNLALTNQYNVKNLDYKSAEFSSMTVKKNKVHLDFQFYNDDHFIRTKNLKGFSVAGVDKVFYPAKVTFNKDKTSIKVCSKKVKNPVAVRYGFEDCFESTLKTTSGLPISIFRTDTW